MLVPGTRKLAGICLVLLLVALFPANVYAALNEIPLRGEAPTPLWIRGPMQLLYIGMFCWTSIKETGESRQRTGEESATAQRGEKQPTTG